MPYRQEQFHNNEIYHVVLKRIEDRLFFKDINDYYRGIFSIYEFNTSQPVEIVERRKVRAKVKRGGDRVSPDQRDKLVEILCFCFMPNHIHLLLRQLKSEGISKFMQKVGAGYARYFKDRYEIKTRGYFFQSRFNSVHIKTEDQLKNVFVYIHTNPISLIEPKWKEKGIQNPKKVIKFLENYKWSSYQDCISKKNFPSVTEREYLLGVMGGWQGCRKSVEDWVKYKGEIKKLTKNFQQIALE